ncbi:MAG: GTPase HflX [Pseudomonadota bacterium]
MTGARTRTLVVHPDIAGSGSIEPDAALEEGKSLTRALDDLELWDGLVVRLARPHPATLMGPGKVEELGARVAAEDIDLVIVNGALSPVQQRNLERDWKTKVLDRTGLILEIFGARAQTREGVLQVDLAHLNYQKSRLVRSWTHLERQRGGAGFMGGPGERQIESDRRQLDERITRLRRQLEKVVKTRALHRAAREKVPFPIVALVGYTNAGKSTLFNRLTEAKVMAEDMLFATLDPTMREIVLPSGRKAILSDTVGFISDLPTELIAAFRATLEEVLAADLVVHVRDVSSEATATQKRDVETVLRDLGLGQDAWDRMIEVLNKTDLLDDDGQRSAENLAARSEGVTCLSAMTGAGVEPLMDLIDARLFPAKTQLDLVLAHRDGAAIAWLYDHGAVDARDDTEAGVHLSVEMTAKELAQFRKQFPGLGETAPDLPRAAE